MKRLLNPKTIAVIGGGAWCAAIIGAARQIGFRGEIFPVHPAGKPIAGIPSVRALSDWNGPIDAAFIGVNRFATVDIVAQLHALDAGGAICFASGFSEAAAEDDAATNLQSRLVEAAGEMPILGPNCYGFLNALDRVGIWPDQHGLQPVNKGVAILTQSSNIAINLTMQMRGVPVAMVITCGNQAQTSQADIALGLLDDPRITAIGLHIEGFGDIRKWEALSRQAQAKGIELVALKSGKSEQAQAATVSHTASLAGADAGAQALLDRLGMARVDNVATFLETLKLAHLFGRLPTGNIASISCSGGEAALVADLAHGTSLSLPALSDGQKQRLSSALGPMVALANPLDYHTYIWRDEAAMTCAWAAMSDPEIALTLIIIDYPRSDFCDAQDWEIATRAVIRAARETGARYAVVSSLPELLPEAIATELMAAGVLALNGLDHALSAIDALSALPPSPSDPIAPAGADRDTLSLSEAEAKAALSAHGVPVPAGQTATRQTAASVATQVGFPVVLKVLGLDHKTGAGGLALNINDRHSVEDALPDLAAGPLWIEQMIPAPIAELLVGVTRDPAHGFVLTIGAGGTLTELLDDTVSLLVPASREQIRQSLTRLKLAPVLAGYRGKPAVDMDATLTAIDAVQAYVLANLATLSEVEVNPLILTSTRAIAADALIRKAPDVPD